MSDSRALALVPDQLTPECIPDLRRQNYLVLSPTDQVRQLNPFFAVRLSHVAVNTETDNYGNPKGPDVWKVPGGRYAPTKVLLNKVAASAGIEWLHDQCKRLDDRKDRFYCAYQAVGRMRLPSGEIRVFKDEAQEDAYLVEEEILDKWLAKVKAGDQLEVWEGFGENRRKKRIPLTEEIARDKAKAEFRQYHKFFSERCLSRAMNRAIRQVLALNGTYTIPELSRGFIVPQVNLSPDWSNPQIAAMAQKALSGQFASMFGDTPPGLEAAEATPPMLEAAATVPQLEAGEPDDGPTEAEIAARLGEVMPEDAEFSEVAGGPISDVYTEEDAARDAAATAATDNQPITPNQIQQLGIKCAEFFGNKKEDQVAARDWLSRWCQRTIQSRKDMNQREARSALRVMDQARDLGDLMQAVADA